MQCSKTNEEKDREEKRKIKATHFSHNLFVDIVVFYRLDR